MEKKRAPIGRIPPPYVPTSNPYEFVPEQFLSNLRNPNEMIINHVIDMAASLLEHYGTNAFQDNPTPIAPQRVHINAALSFPLTTRDRLLNPVGSTRYRPFPARHQIQAAIVPLFLPAHFVTAVLVIHPLEVCHIICIDSVRNPHVPLNAPNSEKINYYTN